MSITVSIICDAAYNEKMRFGGYGGMVMCEHNGETIYSTFSAAVFDSLDSTDAELNAIGAGVIRARQMINRKAKDWGADTPVAMLNVASDSKWGIGALINNLNGKKDSNRYRHVMVGLLHHWRKLDPQDYDMIKVKAHVEENPTPMEALHNKVDVLAVKAKQAAYDAVFNEPSEAAEQYIGVLLPNNAQDPALAHDLTLLGHRLASDNKQLRVAFERRTSHKDMLAHPFVKGVVSANKDAGRDPQHGLLALLGQAPDKNPALDGCMAADRTFARLHLAKHDKTPLRADFFRSQMGIESGQAARLLYGPVDRRRFRLEQYDGRLQERSGRFIDLTKGALANHVAHPKSVSQWATIVADCAKVKVLRGIGAALWEYDLVSGTPLPDVESRFERALDVGLSDAEQSPTEIAATVTLTEALEEEGFAVEPMALADAYHAHKYHPHQLRDVLKSLAKDALQDNESAPCPPSEPVRERPTMSLRR